MYDPAGEVHVPAGEVVYLLGKSMYLLGKWYEHCLSRYKHFRGGYMHFLSRYKHFLSRYNHFWGGYEHFLSRYKLHEGVYTSTFLRRFKMYTLVRSYLLEFLHISRNKIILKHLQRVFSINLRYTHHLILSMKMSS